MKDFVGNEGGHNQAGTRTMDQPHVVIVVENLPVPLDRRVWQEAKALRDGGYRVSVICPAMRGYPIGEERLEGIRILRHAIWGEARGFTGYLKEYASALWGEFWCAIRLWREEGFAVIHLCNPPDLLFLVALPFRLAGVKVVYDMHDLCPEMFRVKFGGRWWSGLVQAVVSLAERCTLRMAHLVLATNQSVRTLAMKRGRKGDAEVVVVRTSPQEIRLDKKSDDVLKNGRKFLVGYVGVMGSADGVDYLLHAADWIVHQQGRTDVGFLLMGTGPEFEHLLALREALGLADQVVMPGRVSEDDLALGLATMDVGVACDPANEYNHACTMNKVLEYMAFEKPMVMFETVEGRYSAGSSALYVTENDAVQLGRGILELLDDPDRRQKMGRDGKQRLTETLGWEHSRAALLSGYAKVAPLLK